MVLELRVDKMTCNHCVSAVSKAVQSIDAKADVKVDLSSGTVVIATNSDGSDEMVTAIEDAGYPVLDVSAH
ncbi:MAG: heavy-metal-associated domain-containing protein [Oligoflexus sp.]